jgi:hypothetical protein
LWLLLHLDQFLHHRGLAREPDAAEIDAPDDGPSGRIGAVPDKVMIARRLFRIRERRDLYAANISCRVRPSTW